MHVNRFLSYRALETEKELSFHEPLHLRAITAVAVDKQAKTIVTGAEDGSVRVWHLFAENQQRKLSLLSSLVAHHTAVSCLDINSKLNILVSGSTGGYVCIWDSQQFSLLYKISGFMGPVVSVSCNAVAGYVLVATADELRLYTVSGELYSYEYFDVYNEENSSCSSKRQEGVGMGPGNVNSTKPNTSFDVSGACTAMIAVPCGDWQDGVVAVTGHSDGSVFLWKLDSKLIEVPYPDVPAAARKTSQATCMIRRLYIACTPEKCHRNEITCLRLSSTSGTTNSTTTSKDAICRAFGDSRHLDLLVGDKDGAVSRWTPFKLDQLSQTDLNSLIAASVSK
jgi:WD40 repeat protein